MPELLPDAAVELARAVLGLDERVPARARRVRRLDRPDADYFLVTLGPDDATVGVASLDARTGELQEWASVPGVRGHVEVDEERARAIAGEGSSAEMVWKPCAASHSRLYPLWEVRTARGVVWVDQLGRIWNLLPESGRGGSPLWPGDARSRPADEETTDEGHSA